MKYPFIHSFIAALAVLLTLACPAPSEADDEKKLKIVFMMGQSNMVGYAAPETAWYLTQPAYVPPAKLGTYKPRFFNWNHYWRGVEYALGSEEFMAKGEALLAERTASRKLWRSRIFGNFSREARAAGKKDEWNYKEWGDPPHVRKIHNREFLDLKAEEAGLYKRMEEYIESPENQFDPNVAIAEIAKRDGLIAEDLERVREIFLRGTKPEDFDKMAEAEAALEEEMKAKKLKGSPFKNRLEYAKFLKKHVRLPIAERTYIAAAGELREDPLPEGKDIKEANGILTVGYGQNKGVSGPEYPFGICFERMVDGPVLIVKVAVGGTSLQGPWRPKSLANAETPIEKAAREARGEQKDVEVGPLWTKAMAHIEEVLADPGKFHPDYDPKAGVELAGLVWFQGWNDLGNKAYGEQLVHFVKDFRKEVKAPELPVVVGLMGHGAWKQNTFKPEPNQGMLYAAQHPDLKGSVDVVNTLPYMPVELGFRKDVEAVFGKESEEAKRANEIEKRAVSKDGTHYFGSAKFVCLTGDAMARKLVNLLKGGEPTIHEEVHIMEYRSKLDALKAEVLEALPKLDQAKLDAYHGAREAEVAAVAELERARKGHEEITEWKRHINDFNEKWIPLAEDRLKEAKEALKEAKTTEEKTAAEAAVEKAGKGVLKEEGGLADRHKKLEAALKKYPNIEEVLKAAEIALPKAETASMAAVKSLGLTGVLQRDELDAKLAACHIIVHATPRGLAAFSQQGAAQKKLIDDLLANGELMVEICIADGAQDGNYGEAMEILEAIHAASSKSRTDPTLRNLALGIALELATPRPFRHAKAEEETAPEFVDPVKRYLAYEKAFLNKELDPCFDDLTVWDMRMVVNGEEPDHIAAWGRQMLANYRPDHILTEDERWRYVDLVRTDIRYGSQDNKFDQDELQFFQNILKNGGICGRRAFIGRFLLRSFGVPVTGRPQPGHAALAHYTPDGWVVCLGAAWGKGGTHTPYKNDLDFVATTQARTTGEDYKQIARAHWIGSAHGETRRYGFRSHREEIPFWNAIALYKQRDLLSKTDAKTLASVGEDIGEANVTKEKVEIFKVELSEEDREVKIANGTITIPAAATSNLTESTEKVIFMPSNQGGLQMHYSRVRDPQTLEYTFEAPKAGKYALTAKVVTPSWKQNLMISANGADPAKLELPHTVGMWETTAPVTVELKAGENVLTMDHETDGYAKGFSIHHFKLTPAS